MFNKTIRNHELTLTRENADRLFPRIGGDEYRRDASLIATLRALLLHRIDDDDALTVRTRRMAFDNGQYRDNTVEALFGATYSRYSGDWKQSLYITNMESVPEAVDTFMAKLPEGMRAMVPDIVEVEDVEKYIEPKVRARIFFSHVLKSAFIFVDHMNYKTFHLIEVFIPRYLPWFFEGKSIQPKEKELLVSLSKTDPELYIRLIEEISNELDIRSYTIRSFLGDFERNSAETRLRNLRSESTRLEEEIRHNEETYLTLCSRLDTTRISIAGLESIIFHKKYGTELMDLFLRNKGLEIIYAGGNELSFNIVTYLDNFDPDMYERYRDNTDSFIWFDRQHSPTFDSAEDRRRLMDALFGDEPSMRIRMCAYMHLDTRGQVSTESYREFGSGFSDYIPNPHLNLHRCFGNHKPIIERLLRGGDIVAAVMQCIASAGSVNIAESVSFGPLLDTIFTTENKVIELQDGTCVTPPEALNWLKNRENPTETEEAE